MLDTNGTDCYTDMQREHHDPVAQWIERQIADLQAGGSSPLGIARAELALSVNSAFFLSWQRGQRFGES